jgi:subtilase family serine protease
MIRLCDRRAKRSKPLRSGDKRARFQSGRSLQIEPLEDRSLLSAGGLAAGLPADGLTPAQISHAYGFDKIQFAGGIRGDGTGQTIAIVDEFDDPKMVDSSDLTFASSDLHMFDLQFGIAEHSGFFRKMGVDQSGNVTTTLPQAAGTSGTALETAMDVEWIHALAPGANIILVEANSDAQIVTALSAAAKIPGVSIVSLSFGAPENMADSLTWYPAFESIGAQHPGVTFVVSSGDEHNGEIVDYPSTSPWALSVGGTQFYASSYPVVDPAGDYVSEEAWNQGQSNATSGGPSTLFSAPSWQSGITGSSFRTTPDVSFHGYGSCYVYDSYDYPSSPWLTSGGTSVAAPSWAALIAIANQGASLKAGTTSSLGHAVIPALYAAYQNSQWYSMAFHDITVGDNNYYSAGTGYDWVTGLGTPKAEVIADWLGQNVPAPTLLAPAAGAFLNTTSPTFQWTPVDTAISYRITLTDNTTGAAVSLQSGFSKDPVTGYLSTSASVPLVSGHSYTFSVWSQLPNLSNPGGGANLLSSPVSASATFTVLTSLAVPTLVWPVNSDPITVTPTPTCSWSAVFGATGYYVDVWDLTTNQEVIHNASVSVTSYTPGSPLTIGDTYGWRVMAYNASGLQSAWSDYAYTIPEATVPVLSISNVTLSEGNSGTKTFSFTVSLTGANTLPTSVSYATANGTATAGSDYAAASGTLNWADGDATSKTISVTVNGDTTVEPDETFYVNLSSPTNATLSTNRGVGTIVNDDLSVSSVVVAEAVAKNNILESNENLKITWTTSSAYSLASQTLTVDGKGLAPINGPYSGSNYSCTIGTWPAGSHTYAIQTTDSKGVISSATGTFNVVAPPSSGPTIGQATVSQAKGRISWNVVDPDGVASSTIVIDGKASAVSGPFTAASGVNFSAPLGLLAAGSHAYTITATDKLGNQSSSNGDFQIQGPTISNVTVSETKGRISWNAFSANGIASSTLKIDGTAVSNVGGPYTATSGVNFSAPLPVLAAGDHDYSITATDKAGSPVTVTGAFTLTNPITNGPTISAVTVSQAKGRISWNSLSANGVASSTIVVDGKALGVSGPYSAASGVNFSAPLGQLAAGSHSYTITATDRLGGVSNLTATFSLTSSIGSSGPTISPATVSQAKGRISWNVVDADGVRSTTLAIDGTNVPSIAGPFTAASGVNFSAALGSLAAGDHAYTITATDLAGNVSTSSGTFTLASLSGAANNALISAARLSALSDSVKVDWLDDDPDAILRGALSTSDDKAAVDAVLAAYA